MSEVNGPKIGVNQFNYLGIQKQNNETPQEVVESKKQITDFSDNKAEALGRSMLFKGVDNLSQDLKVLLENPQIAENSDEIFETTYKLAMESGSEHPYEVASNISTTSF